MFISYASADWTLGDGQLFPVKKPFVETGFDLAQRRFDGLIDWTVHGTTAGGALRWRYAMIFDPNYESISGGTVEVLAPGGEVLETVLFGQDVVYEAK